MRHLHVLSGSLHVEAVGALELPAPVTWAEVFVSGGVHELLFEPEGAMLPSFLAIWAAQHCALGRPMVWVDSLAGFYPPAVGSRLEQLHILRPAATDLIWAAVECLRCKQVGAVIAVIPHRPARVEVRRLQLAAEHGGSVGILLRPNLDSAGVHIYSAASRWLVSPTPGERTIQRWCVEHVHGHGRQFGPSFIVEKNRATGETHLVHPPAALDDHTKIAKAL